MTSPNVDCADCNEYSDLLGTYIARTPPFQVMGLADVVGVAGLAQCTSVTEEGCHSSSSTLR